MTFRTLRSYVKPAINRSQKRRLGVGKRGPKKGSTFQKKVHDCPDCGLVQLESAGGRKRCDACRRLRQAEAGKARWADPEKRAKALAATKSWADRNKEYRKEYNRKRNLTRGRYGFSREFLDEQMLRQGGRCALEGAGNCHGDLVVDHCHESGRFRGWLCRQHNAALGKLGDTIDSILVVLDYLDKARENGDRWRK